MLYILKGIVNKILQNCSYHFIFFFVLYNSLSSQNIDLTHPDSYQKGTLDFTINSDRKDAIECGQLKLLIAKKEKDTANIISNYYDLGNSYTDETYLSYMDTVLQLTKGKKSFEYIRALTYSDLYLYYMDEYDYIKAMNYLIKTKDYAVILNNDQLLRYCKEDLVTIKANFGNMQEAINFYIEDIKRLRSDSLATNKICLANHYSNLSYYLTMTKKYDSAKYYNKMGRNLVKNLDITTYRYLMVNKGITLYHLGNLKDAKQIFENLETAYGNLNMANYVEIHYYLGKVNKDLGNYDASYSHFKKIDSLYEKKQKMSFEYRDTYHELMNMHDKNDYEIRLEYVNKLLKFDSLYAVNANYINNKVLDKFDIPALLKEKESLITHLARDNEKFKIKSIWYQAIVVLIITLMGYQTFSIIKYKQKAIQLVSELDKIPIDGKKVKTIAAVPLNKTLNISDETITHILSQLSEFEKELGFLDPNLTLQQLAKQVGSNSKYLSKIIKVYKANSFYGYIQNLRIDHVLNRLKNDTRFRELTIDAIATESGYNQRGSFSKSFEKITGVKPSYFIKELKRQSKNIKN